MTAPLTAALATPMPAGVPPIATKARSKIRAISGLWSPPRVRWQQYPGKRADLAGASAWETLASGWWAAAVARRAAAVARRAAAVAWWAAAVAWWAAAVARWAVTGARRAAISEWEAA